MAIQIRKQQSRLLLHLLVILILLTRPSAAGSRDSGGYKPALSYDESRAAFPTTEEAFPDDEDHLIKLERMDDLNSHRRLSDADRQYVLALMDYLTDKRHDDGRRETAARYLGIYGHSIAISALLAVIRDEDDDIEVRMRAIHALGAIRDKRVVMYIVEEGLASGNDNLIIASMDALAGLLGDAPPKLLQKKGIVWWGFVPPPGYTSEKGSKPADPEKLETYLDTWRQWWRENYDEVQLSRGGGMP